MKQVVYRRAEHSDCRGLAQLKHNVWETTYRGIYSDAKIDGYDIGKNETKFRAIIANPHITSYVAMSNGAIVGFMSCGKPLRPFGTFEQEIGLLYILETYQRQGIGKTFFRLAQDSIRARGYNAFFISVNKYNVNAIAFYQAMGGTIKHIDEEQVDKSAVQIKLGYRV